MNIGKLPNELLKELVLDKLKVKRPEVFLGAGIGEDCCAVDFGPEICVLSSDPITGTANDIGRLAVHVSCNDIAASGAEPLGLLVTILLPPDVSEEELAHIADQISEASAELRVDVIGGHTEVTEAVNRVVIMTTAVGKVLKEGMVRTAGARPGDDIIVTKTVGIEGTAIIAKERSNEIERRMGKQFLLEASGFVNSISVVKEGIIAAKYGANAMHDVTEGGIMGALWELAEASDCGVEVIKRNIPVAEVTRRICDIFGIDPLKLISSGCMLITAQDGEKLSQILNSSGIQATVIGKVHETKEKIVIDKDKRYSIESPGPDELYKAFENVAE